MAKNHMYHGIGAGVAKRRRSSEKRGINEKAYGVSESMALAIAKIKRSYRE